MNANDVHRICQAAAAHYARRCWWAEVDDLRQEAYLAALRAQRTFQANVGVVAEAYVWRAVVLALAKYLWNQSSPVSGGSQNPKLLKTQQRASGDELDWLLSIAPPVDEQVDELRWREAVHARVDALLRTPEHVLAARVVVDEMQAADVARETGLPVLRIYKLSEHLRDRLARDPELYALIRSRKA